MRSPRGPLSSFLVLLSAAGGACVPRADAAPQPGAPPVLLELFTSQGCSSCPPADALVRDLPRLGLDRTRVVPLTFHVDYWNDLGWKDPFSSPVFTDRQRVYAQAGVLRSPRADHGLSGIYTPQMIINGAVQFSGARRDLALAELARAAALPPGADLEAAAKVEPDRARVTARVTARPAAGGTGAPAQRWRLFVALAARSARTQVTRGENRGEQLEEAAVVRVLSDPIELEVPSDGAPTPPVSIVVQRPSDLPWSSIELSAVLQSAATLRVGAVRAIPFTVR